MLRFKITRIPDQDRLSCSKSSMSIHASSYPQRVQPHSVPLHSVCWSKTIFRVPKDEPVFRTSILKVLVTYENIMVGNIKVVGSKLNQHLVINYSTFSFLIILDFYSASIISPLVNIWKSAWVPGQKVYGKMLEAFTLYYVLAAKVSF